MKIKKSLICVGVGFLAASGILLATNGLDKGQSIVAEQDAYKLTLNNENAPTITGTTGSLSYHSATLTYTNVETSVKGGHVALLAGGKITKDEAKGLQNVVAVFEGNLTITTGYSDDDMVYQYQLESGEEQAIQGNYFEITTSVDTEITSIELTYNCDEETEGVEHTYDKTKWAHDEKQHYHASTEEHCISRADAEDHIFYTTAGGKVECMTCGAKFDNTIVDDPVAAGDASRSRTRFEYELAHVDHFATTYTDWRKEFSDVNNMSLGFGLGNKLCSRNANYAGNKFSFDFISDHAYNVDLYVHVSTHADTGYPFDVNKRLAIYNQGTLAGETVTRRADFRSFQVESKDDTVNMVSGGNADPQYFNFVERKFTMPIFEGTNKIWFEYLGQSGCNIDYMEIDTSAAIEVIGEYSYYDNVSSWTITKFPSVTEKGVVTISRTIEGALRTYSYGIPALMTDDEVTEGYTKVSDTLYKTTIKGKEFEIDLTKKPVVTLGTDKIKFADSSESTKSYDQGTKLASTVVSNVANYDLNTVDTFTAAGAGIGTNQKPADISVTDDITLNNPTFVRTGYKLLTPGNEQSGSKPQSTSFSPSGGMPGDNWSVTTGNVTKINGGEDGVPMLGNVFKYKTDVTSGNFCRLNSIADSSTAVVTMNKNHQFDYNFENLGTTTITFTMYQINQQANVESGDSGHTAVLKPGESVHFNFTRSFAKGSANKNLLTKIVFNDAIKDGFSLGVAFAWKKAS